MNKAFQTFDEQGDASQCGPRLAALRGELKRRGVDGVLVPRSDEHQGEHVAKRAVWPGTAGPREGGGVLRPLGRAGETSEWRRAGLAEDLKKRGADAVGLPLPDSICWLWNMRGADVPHTPFALSFAVLSADASVD